jgi:hypothetical protein
MHEHEHGTRKTEQGVHLEHAQLTSEQQVAAHQYFNLRIQCDSFTYKHCLMMAKVGRNNVARFLSFNS